MKVFSEFHMNLCRGWGKINDINNGILHNVTVGYMDLMCALALISKNIVMIIN